jgi:cytochrome c-type biogenesis protein CcmF
VLGWGGYWAWDPVENASFMPWLTATAFMHSAMVQERRNMLRTWNMSLVIVTFLLTILGTFLTRSGVLSSVHAFSEGPIGLYFMGFIAVTLLFSVVVLTGRSHDLRSEAQLDQMASRETVFLLNNLLLTAFTFTVLLGTMFPLVAEAVRGVKLSVGAPFYNRMTLPICVALLFLIGVGPMLPWRVSNSDELKRKLRAPSAAFIITAVAAFALGLRSFYGLLAFGFAAWATVTNLQEFAYAAAARRSTGRSWFDALFGLFSVNPRRYGGYVAHLGLIMMAVGITGSSVFRYEREATLRPGQSVQLREYTVRFDDLQAHDEAHRFVVLGNFTVFIDGVEAGKLDPRLNYYRSRGASDPITTPSVRTRADNDLYINLIAFERDGSSATVHVIVEPLVVWIWVGGFIVAMGALIGLWPRRRRPSPLQQRPSPERVPVSAA